MGGRERKALMLAHGADFECETVILQILILITKSVRKTMLKNENCLSQSLDLEYSRCLPPW